MKDRWLALAQKMARAARAGIAIEKKRLREILSNPKPKPRPQPAPSRQRIVQQLSLFAEIFR
jgi:hypothetical protein